LRDLGQRRLDGLKRVLPRDQADRVLSLWNAAGCGGGDAIEAAPPQRKIEFQAVAAGEDGAMLRGQARELNHGVDDLLLACNGRRLAHPEFLNGWRSICHATRRVTRAGQGSLTLMSSSISRDNSTMVSG
jgi:hypothetical protein